MTHCLYLPTLSGKSHTLENPGKSTPGKFSVLSISPDPGYLLKHKSMHSHNNYFLDAYGGCIFKSWTLETIQSPAADEWEQIMGHPYNGLPLSYQRSDLLDESQNHTKWKQPDTKTLCSEFFWLYEIQQKAKLHGRKQINGSRRLWLKKKKKESAVEGPKGSYGSADIMVLVERCIGWNVSSCNL